VINIEMYFGRPKPITAYEKRIRDTRERCASHNRIQAKMWREKRENNKYALQDIEKKSLEGNIEGFVKQTPLTPAKIKQDPMYFGGRKPITSYEERIRNTRDECARLNRIQARMWRQRH
ncbi:hypothetical protein OTU49_012686, partial [Cherax quadricarinatus]